MARASREAGPSRRPAAKTRLQRVVAKCPAPAEAGFKDSSHADMPSPICTEEHGAPALYSVVDEKNSSPIGKQEKPPPTSRGVSRSGPGLLHGCQLAFRKRRQHEIFEVHFLG